MTAPAVVVTFAAMMAAATSTSIELKAIDRPIATATPASPPMPAARDAPTATLRIEEKSSAVMLTDAARTVTGGEGSPGVAGRVSAVDGGAGRGVDAVLGVRAGAGESDSGVAAARDGRGGRDDEGLDGLGGGGGEGDGAGGVDVGAGDERFRARVGRAESDARPRRGVCVVDGAQVDGAGQRGPAVAVGLAVEHAADDPHGRTRREARREHLVRRGAGRDRLVVPADEVARDRDAESQAHRCAAAEGERHGDAQHDGVDAAF